MTKRIQIPACTIAAFVLLGSAAFAAESSHDYPGAVVRGAARSYTPDANGVPSVMPWFSDRSYRRERSFHPGAFKELGPEQKVEWRR